MRRTFVILVLKFEVISHQGDNVVVLWKKKRHNFKLFEISQFKIMPITTRTDVFDFQVLNYLKLSSNCSVIEPCPCGSWYCEVCQVCHPEFFKQIYVLNLFQNQLTFLQLHLGIGMCDMHTINA